MSKLGEIKYVSCPYCPFRYKHETTENFQAMAGHINLKHPDVPKVKTDKDFVIQIPQKDPKLANKEKAELKKRLEAQLKALENS